MLLKDLPNEFRGNHIFRYSCGQVEYRCKATYLPFGICEAAKYEKMELEEICTPLIHLEWEATNTEESIYQSHFIMAYSVIWWFNNRNKMEYDEMVCYSALETGYLDRVKEENKGLSAGVQLNIFSY